MWRAGQLRNGHGGGGILCLALPALHTGSSGAQGPWSEFKTKPQPAVPIRGYGPAGPLRGQGACLLEGAARTGVPSCATPGGEARDLASSVLRTGLQASSSSRRLTPARPEAQHSQSHSQSGRASRPARFIQDHPARPTRNRERSRSTRARPQIFSHPPNPVVCLFSTASDNRFAQLITVVSGAAHVH